MGPHIRIVRARDGEVVKLPQDLDKLVIWTAKGYILIDLGEQVEIMVPVYPCFGSDLRG